MSMACRRTSPASSTWRIRRHAAATSKPICASAPSAATRWRSCGNGAVCEAGSFPASPCLAAVSLDEVAANKTIACARLGVRS
jgi:hypothetical protein